MSRGLAQALFQHGLAGIRLRRGLKDRQVQRREGGLERAFQRGIPELQLWFVHQQQTESRLLGKAVDRAGLVE